ncbi:flagellar basal body rod protein FlgC [Paenibacillus sediminis]|uniref:Flagellar basal-body rod protein FlgC n=1 Tax=Paenibacillus sediminis TaxID=664909 RepID=A0ABS4H2T4_9BACL|nr:flagellar basal body rod protein FlgC [Paenibacillus sediminis]MBP1936430.1 flagellar basal-body rod protein FlgC [Paenibacillus sediminis]
MSSISNSFNISASGLTSQRLRMDVISSNIANADTTRASVVNGQAVPYKRKMVVMSTNETSNFADVLQSKMTGSSQATGEGVKVSEITEDTSPLKPVYDPTHPDADENGYVYYPNVDTTKEMIDMISATRSYEANVTAFNAAKSIFSKALQIGK